MQDDQIYTARLELIDFLVEVFHDTPSEAFVERLLEGDIVMPTEEVNDHLDTGFEHLRSFIDDHRGHDPETLADELATEYTSLFAGPRPPVLPHETYYREDTEFIGEGLAEIQADYSAAGWASPEEYPEEDDFIAVELGFLRYLVDRQRAGHEETFGFERVFLDEHLLRWCEDLLADIESETDNDLFLAAGHVFVGLCEFEDELVAQMVPG